VNGGILHALVGLGLAATLGGCGEQASAAGATAAAGATPVAGELHPIEYVVPRESPRVATAQQGVVLRCSSCHSVKPPNPAARRGDDLVHFHQGLRTAHGELTCLSCHDSRDYDRLRQADLTPVAFPDVMTLCRQCHGPQARDYDHGSHGGMTGYWDRSRGKRVRNACTVCHDPHAPAFVGMMPAPGPRDHSGVRKGSH
jgi:hypothetical protein